MSLTMLAQGMATYCQCHLDHLQWLETQSWIDLLVLESPVKGLKTTKFLFWYKKQFCLQCTANWTCSLVINTTLLVLVFNFYFFPVFKNYGANHAIKKWRAFVSHLKPVVLSGPDLNFDPSWRGRAKKGHSLESILVTVTTREGHSKPLHLILK